MNEKAKADETPRVAEEVRAERNLRQACGLSILVVDDTPTNQKIVSYLLGQRGHQVTVANHGRAALDLSGSSEFDVVLLDVEMPIMNGFAAVLAIRAQEGTGGRHVPIIALTTHSDEVSQQKWIAAGMDAYLTKPLDSAPLIDLVEELGNRHRRVAATPSRSHEIGTTLDMGDAFSVIDVAGSLKRLGGDVELFKEFVRLFDEDSPAMLESLRTAIAARDGVVVERVAHSLRGLTANFGARYTVKAAGQLEEMGQQGLWEGVEQAAAQLANEIRRLNAALDEFRK